MNQNHRENNDESRKTKDTDWRNSYPAKIDDRVYKPIPKIADGGYETFENAE